MNAEKECEAGEAGHPVAFNTSGRAHCYPGISLSGERATEYDLVTSNIFQSAPKLEVGRGPSMSTSDVRTRSDARPLHIRRATSPSDRNPRTSSPPPPLLLILKDTNLSHGVPYPGFWSRCRDPKALVTSTFLPIAWRADRSECAPRRHMVSPNAHLQCRSALPAGFRHLERWERGEYTSTFRYTA